MPPVHNYPFGIAPCPSVKGIKPWVMSAPVQTWRVSISRRLS